MSQFPLNPGQLTLADLRAWYFEPQQLELAESAIEDIERSAATVQKVLDKGALFTVLIPASACSPIHAFHPKS